MFPTHSQDKGMPRSWELQADFGDTSGANFDTFTPKQADSALQVIQNLLATKPLNADEDWHGKSRHIVSITDNAVLLNSFGQ